MTDLEITRLCAEAMGYPEAVHYDPHTPPPVAPAILVGYRHGYEVYEPLADDAQAMALVKKFDLNIQPDHEGWCASDYTGDKFEARNSDLNRAICECVAKMRMKK